MHFLIVLNLKKINKFINKLKNIKNNFNEIFLIIYILIGDYEYIKIILMNFINIKFLFKIHHLSIIPD